MKWKQSKLSAEYELFRKGGYTPYTAMSLCKAGIKTLDEAEDYLSGNELHSFHLIRNIQKATDIIWEHVYSRKRICIFGDYDADGVTASAIMFLALKKLGANVAVRLPDRINEGYGISEKAISEQLDLGTGLFITVDNGVRAINETKFIKEHGADIVILDHHEPGEELPDADALIDLHIPGETYPFIELTGSALAWKVAHYMLEQMGEHEYALSLIDLAAIGTIGDVAPLHGENRVIVKRALEMMRRADYDRVGVRALMKDLSFITAEDIAFKLVPCLNAPGRLTEKGAELPLILLLENDRNTAEQLAAAVIRDNENRKKIQAECYSSIREAAEMQIEQGDKILVLYAENAPSGIVGLLAGNLKEEFMHPAIVFSQKENSDGEKLWVGSARSIEAFHMLQGIEQCSPVLERFGGHRLAAGLTVLPKNFEAFRAKINDAASYLTEADLNPNGLWDISLSQEELSDTLYEEMQELEPYGAGAPRLVVKTRIILSDKESHRFMGTEGQHLKLFADNISLVGFSLAEKYMKLCLPHRLITYGNLTMNNYRGQSYRQISMLDFAVDEENETERGEANGRKDEYQADMCVQDEKSSA
jgi:single-stranded-DNA-specific exonuclease